MGACAPVSLNTDLSSVPKSRRSLCHLPEYTWIISDLINSFEICESRNKRRNEAELEDSNNQDLGWGGGNIKDKMRVAEALSSEISPGVSTHHLTSLPKERKELQLGPSLLH